MDGFHMNLDHLRDKIKELMKQREAATLEKGLSAQDNKDLRENAEYDYWEEKETTLTIKIGNLQQEIVQLSEVNVKKTLPKKLKKGKETVTPKIKDLPKNKWL